jgi:quercetin 2,3-dioxygenase
MTEGEAKIFLAGKRGRTESSTHRSFHTFSFGQNHDENHNSFFSLNAINDETLAAGTTITYNVAADSLVCLLPIIGGIERTQGDGTKGFLEAGQCEFVMAKAGSVLHLRNPYELELVNYLTVWIDASMQDSSVKKLQLALDQHPNSLATIFSDGSVNIHIGQFGGRIDNEFTLNQKANGLFVFVIEGAVEFDNRLLQQRDGLAIWKKSKVEFESLTAESILLLIEV